MIDFDFGKVIKRIRDNVREGREVSYGEGEVGITSLLSCPIKAELKKKYPDVEPVAVEIDDGYVWEQQAKTALRSVVEESGGRFEEEKDLVDEVDGIKIRGHLDCFVEFENEVWGIELKSPKAIILKKFPEEEKLTDGVFLLDNGEYVINNPHYYLQARIQKYLLKKHYPDKKVYQFIFYKAPVRRGRYEKKLYILVPVEDDITREEYREIVRKFKEDKSPRYPNECVSYCEYYRQGLCEGREFSYDDGDTSILDGEVKELIREYRDLQSQMKTIESILKRKIKGSVKFGGKEIGWVTKEVVDLDVEKIISLLPPEELSEFFMVKWTKKDDIVRRLGEEVVKEIRTERRWVL